jgi:hypothetical protein
LTRKPQLQIQNSFFHPLLKRRIVRFNSSKP